MSEKSQNTNSQPEPSVLDYFKALLTPWRGEIPPIPELSDEIESVTHPVQSVSKETAPESEMVSVPWRSLLALLLALGGQLMLQPTLHKGVAGGVLYLLAVGAAIWGMIVGELHLAEPRPTDDPQEEDDLSVVLWPLIAGLLLLAAAFLAFGRNQFTDFNLLLWFGGIAMVLWSFWYPRPDLVRFFKRVVQFFRRDRWQVTITLPVVLFIVVLSVGIFFRYNHLGDVVPEMVSDHAEKLWDVYDVLDGDTKIFFPRNTGREGLQMYLIAQTIRWFDTGISFLSMKIGTVTLGVLMLPFMYLIGVELGNRTVGLLAMFFSGITFWLNSLARVALRFIFYPAFAAPAIYFLLHGLRSGRRRDFILSGFFLGIGLHGYTPIRAVPILIVVAFVLFWLHNRSKETLSKALIWLSILAIISLVLFLPLLRVWINDPGTFNQRTITRLTDLEVGDEMPSGLDLAGVFISNVWNGLLMLNWDSGSVWVNTIPHAPSLDLISGALFVLGVGLLFWRYLQERKWQDAFLLLAVPILMLPSTLVLAYPHENPSPNRASGAAVVVFIIIALALEALFQAVKRKMNGETGIRFAWLLVIVLALAAARGNYTMTFKTYQDEYTRSAWNTSELGAVIEQFIDTIGEPDQAWVVAYPHWVDTRLVGINAGQPDRDYAIWPEEIEVTLAVQSPKLFLFRLDDETAREVLEETYPSGTVSLYTSEVPSHSFFIYYVP
jgi:undecaprenyl pyrophosphate phosphatase UppP